MGCTKAFDVPDPNIIEVLLQKHGWPDKSGSLLPLGPKMRYVSWGHHTHVIRSTSRAKRPQKQQAIPTPCKWWQGTAKQTKIQNNTKERHRSQLGFFLFGLLDADRGPILCFLTRGGNCSVSAIAVATRINFLPSLSDGIIRIDGEVIGMMVGAASCGLRFRNVTSSLLLRLES